MAEKKAPEKKSMKLYEAEMRILLSIPEKERGRILTALLIDSMEEESEEHIELEPMENAVYELISGQLERAKALSDVRSQAALSKHESSASTKGNGKNPVQDGANAVQKSSKPQQAETNGQQNSANTQQTLSKPEQTLSKRSANACTITNTITSTNTNTITNTSSSSGDARADEAEPVPANVIHISPEPEFSGQGFESTPEQESSMNEILDYWRKNVGDSDPALYRVVKIGLKAGMEPALICRGIDKAVPTDQPKRYLGTILGNWKREGMLTLEAYEAAHPESIPKFSSGVTQGVRRGLDGLGPPSYDLNEIDQLLRQEATRGAGTG